MIQWPVSVLHFSNSPVRAGVEEHILRLLQGLDRNRFHPLLVCPPELTQALRRDLPADVEVFSLFLESPAQGRAVRELARILRERRVHILHSHQFRAALIASPIGRWCGVPLNIETAHVREKWRRGWLKGSYAIDRLADRFVDHYIAVSNAIARYLIDEKCLPSDKVTVIYNGCDVRRFSPEHRPPPGLKRSLGFEETDLVLLVLARLEPQKGHHILFEGLPRVRAEFPNARLVCAGEGELRSSLEEQVRNLGLEEAVRFVGFQSNVEDWLALAELTILPSFYEGLPVVAVESLAAGRPVVATAVDGTPEIVINGVTGLTVPAGEPQRLAEAICKFLRDPELRARIGRAGRERVLQAFSQEQQVENTEKLYLRSIEQRLMKKQVIEAAPATDAGGEHKAISRVTARSGLDGEPKKQATR
ncbi:MAG TPA: glycosyltransferase family 4 protein [Terriglobia bacterium]|nr:glycosyltransferase family 4 protein [Terriglobia bacterium]